MNKTACIITVRNDEMPFFTWKTVIKQRFSTLKCSEMICERTKNCTNMQNVEKEAVCRMLDA